MINLVRSMTGYGKGEYENQLYRFVVEIKSVNHRYSNIFVRIPRHISYLEEFVKGLIKHKLQRGKIDVFINLEYLEDSPVDVNIDIPLAKSYKSALEKLTSSLSLNDPIELSNLLDIEEIISFKRKDLDEEKIKGSLEEATKIALENIMEMRLVEGKELKKDILVKLDKIKEYLLLIEKRSPNIVTEYREKLSERIKDLLDDTVELDEDRLENEIAFFADRSSIDEEIIRLKSHLNQFDLILEEDNSIGRKLDFLIQELNREINTIGSKANDEKITKLVVETKSELEKIREQVQNIE